MVRMVILFLGGIIAVTILRAVMGMIGKALGDLVTQPAAGSPKAATRGSLKKCDVCGVHAVPHVSRGEKNYCSPECAAKA